MFKGKTSFTYITGYPCISYTAVTKQQVMKESTESIHDPALIDELSLQDNQKYFEKKFSSVGADATAQI